MAKDKRKKGCPNEDCINHIKKIRLKADEEICPVCGEQLIFVCRKCFCEIQDIDEKHRVCRRCMEESIEKKEQRKEKAKEYTVKAGAAVGVAVVGIGGKIINKVYKNVEKDAVKAGVQFLEKAAKVVIKR